MKITVLENELELIMAGINSESHVSPIAIELSPLGHVCISSHTSGEIIEKLGRLLLFKSLKKLPVREDTLPNGTSFLEQ